MAEFVNLAAVRNITFSSTMSSADVAIIREWIKKNKHLPQNLDDYFIQCFVTSAKGSIQKAKQNLENFCMFRHHHEFRYKLSWDPFSDDLEPTLNRLNQLMLPKKTPEGHNLFLCYIDKAEPDPNFVLKMMVLGNYFVQMLLWEHQLGNCQGVFIVDWKNATFQDFQGCTPTFLSEVAALIKGASPQRVKGIYDINVPPVITWAFNAIKPFMGAKMEARRFAYSNTEDLYKHVPKELLPSDYGGSEPSVHELYETKFKKLFVKYRERLTAQKEEVLAEKPFVPTHLTVSDYDTFRKLDID